MVKIYTCIFMKKWYLGVLTIYWKYYILDKHFEHVSENGKGGVLNLRWWEKLEMQMAGFKKSQKIHSQMSQPRHSTSKHQTKDHIEDS